jgi:hypothetical protein
MRGFLHGAVRMGLERDNPGAYLARTLNECKTLERGVHTMKSLISAAALAAVLGAVIPAAAQAADVPATSQSAAIAMAAPGMSFLLVDPTTGAVIGRLVSVGSNTHAIAAMAARARSDAQAQTTPAADAVPKTNQDWQAYWNRINPTLSGP